MKIVYLLLLVLLLLIPFIVFGKQSYMVTRVVDGDTIHLEKLGSVRLLGIDTPETVHPRKPVECYGPQATMFLKETVLGETVRVKYGRDKKDRYGRILAYIYLGRMDVNGELVKRGLAYVYPSRDKKEVLRYVGFARSARLSKRGLWGGCYK